MEKLIELLNEYEPRVHYLDKPKGVYNKKYGIGWYKREGDVGGWFSEEVIISKRYGFIKWLVENDKIDFSQIPNKIKEIGIPMKINGEIKYGFDSSDYYWLLMLLSISDTPIDFLCEILK